MRQQTHGTATAETTERAAEQAAQMEVLKPLYLRMTPEILAELAFQQASLTGSRLSHQHQKTYWEKLSKYISDVQKSL